MSRSGYLTPGRLAAIEADLTAEDWSLLKSVTTVRLASATQLQRVRDVRGLASVRRFRRQLARLDAIGVLARLEQRTIGGRSAGSASYVYGVGLAGQRLLTPERRSRHPWTPRPIWLQHALAVSECYVRLIEAERMGRLKLVRFEAEPKSWRRFAAAYGGVLTLKPDAFVLLHVGEFEDRSFIEVDQGTESRATLMHKFETYRRYWQSGTEQASGLFPRVLWLVPSARRLAVLADVTEHQPAEARLLFAACVFDDAIEFLTKPP